MNKTNKGNRKELVCKKELEAGGYKVVFKSAHIRWHMVDFANLFDVIGFKPSERRYVSCKTVKNGITYPQHQEEIKQFKTEYGYPGELFELWLWTAGRYRGREEKKVWIEPHWEKIII